MKMNLTKSTRRLPSGGCPTCYCNLRNKFIKSESEKNRKDIRNILKKLEFCYQKAGLVKYDAYNQMGGNLSFCLCMLNERNSGFILNSVHSSDGCYTYTKEIKNGECEIALGEEERKALNMAIGF